MTQARSLTTLMEPQMATMIIIWLGWLMVALGAFKMAFYLIGELFPAAWAKIKSPTFKKFLTGNGNRLIFGLGGFLTIILGIASVGIAILIRRLYGLG